jgi:alpha,alpha-trehalase
MIYLTKPSFPKAILLVFVSWLCVHSTFAQINFEKDFSPLFHEVQMQAVFPDSKTFPDCIPLFSPQVIMNKYTASADKPGFDLKVFVLANFRLPDAPGAAFKSTADKPVDEHIKDLWKILTRQPNTTRNSSLIPLPHPYVVPGGRFREIYYWDSYFTMLGLQASGEKQLIRNMVDNFTYLINTQGFIPNGNRTYFTSRSQPPFFSLMVGILAEVEGKQVWTQYLPVLEKEYKFWMDGASSLSVQNPTHRRVVRLPNGEIVNRYYDDSVTPRTESYKEDVETARKSGRKPEELYKDLKAACESGWDFSSRWFQDGKTLTTIHTTQLIPVDLNALLYQLELNMAYASELKGDSAKKEYYTSRAAKRKAAIIAYCWNAEKGYFFDYDFVAQKQKTIYSLAALYPLFFKMATPVQAQAVAKVVEAKFSQPGGVLTTLINTSQQWDAPNGWPPLQYITIQGLFIYKEDKLAATIRDRWVQNNIRVYENTGKMVEKYNVTNKSLKAGGGEYPLQDGFGWSNGVLLKLLTEGRQ